MPHTPSKKGRGSGARATIAAITIGNALEFFDFTVFGFLSSVIGKQFFPHASSYGQLLLAAGTFGVGFVMRPIGGIVIGTYADRVGRKPAMTLSILLMAAGCGVLALTPTYAQIGIAAPLLVVLARLLQGLSAGGEVGPSISMLVEYGAGHNRCYVASWALASQGVGVVLGALIVSGLTAGLSTQAMESWGWRIPFALGLTIAPVGTYIRSRLHESLDSPRANVPARQTGILAALLAKHRRTLAGGVLSSIGTAVAIQVVTFYMPNYAIVELKLASSSSLATAAIIGLTFVVLAPLVGRTADRLGRKPLITVCRLLFAAALFPAFYWLNSAPGVARLSSVIALLSVLLVGQCVPNLTLFPESLTKEVRATGVALAYSISIVIGGFSPLVTTWLVKVAGYLAPAGYLCAVMIVSLLGLPLLKDRTGQPIDDDPEPPAQSELVRCESVHCGSIALESRSLSSFKS